MELPIESGSQNRPIDMPSTGNVSSSNEIIKEMREAIEEQIPKGANVNDFRIVTERQGKGGEVAFSRYDLGLLEHLDDSQLKEIFTAAKENRMALVGSEGQNIGKVYIGTAQKTDKVSELEKLYRDEKATVGGSKNKEVKALDHTFIERFSKISVKFEASKEEKAESSKSEAKSRPRGQMQSKYEAKSMSHAEKTAKTIKNLTNNLVANTVIPESQKDQEAAEKKSHNKRTESADKQQRGKLKEIQKGQEKRVEQRKMDEGVK